MTEIRCIKCNKLLGVIKVHNKHNDFNIIIKCPRCKCSHEYIVKIEKLEDHESQGA